MKNPTDCTNCRGRGVREAYHDGEYEPEPCDEPRCEAFSRKCAETHARWLATRVVAA